MDFNSLTGFLKKIPSIKSGISTGVYDDGNWWCKFQIDITHQLAWNVVQELGHIINLISVNEKLPTVFYPVSPPSYLNGGPEEYLSWIIESKEKEFVPDNLTGWFVARLPDPVDDIEEWLENNEE
jgi:hypothetical protein